MNEMQQRVARALVTSAQDYAKDRVAELPECMRTNEKDMKALHDMLTAAYLSGVSRITHWLSVSDGMVGCTPQTVTGAVQIAASELGFGTKSDKKDPRAGS